MLHAREDYNRIQDPLGKIGKDEPVFLIRAQDVLMLGALEFYKQSAESIDAQPELIEAVDKHIQRVREWQTTHGYKSPDIPT